LEPESEASVSLEIISDKGTMPLTAFSNFIAAQTSSSKEQTVAQVHEHLGIPAKGMVQEVGRILSFNILSKFYAKIPLSRTLYLQISEIRINFFFKSR